MRSLSRRDFLHGSAALAAASAGADFIRAADEKPKKRDANDQLRVAVIGVHSRGVDHVKGFAGRHNCVVATVCDVDEAVVSKAMKAAEKAQGKPPKYERDLRRVFDDNSIDVVSIATPNHWHSLAAIWAMQAGKDVYVEKPVSHNVSEGRRVVETARKYQRICQAGTQCRSMEGTREAIEFMRSGKLGKIRLARGLCYKRRPSIGKVSGPQEPPKTMDYDLWCGPAPNNPPARNGVFGPVHYDWHWVWDYGNGDLGNQGIHQMDVARWGLGKKGLAKSVLSVGGRFGYVDDGQTPNTQIAVFDYGDCELIFEVRGLPTKHLNGAKVGNIFYGTKGYLVCPSYESAVAYSNDGDIIKVFARGGDHYGNFVQAVRSRKPELLRGEIEEGHLSSALCHLANISYRLGSPQPANSEAKAFGDDKDASETLGRTAEHLRANTLSGVSYTIGRKLTVDSATETFVNDKEADALLTRAYRKGFEVPEKV